MPNRIIREAILDSDAVNALSVPAELFYRRLMSVVDDFGRFDARPSVLRSRCYPLRVASVREADISRWLAECETAGLLALYSSDGRQYLLFRKLGEPRAKSSKFPAPPASLDGPSICAHMRADVSGCAQTSADVPYSDSYSDSSKPPNPPLPFPSEAFATAWGEWESHRRQKGKKLTDSTIKKQLKYLASLGESQALKTLEFSTRQGWDGLYPPKDSDSGSRGVPEIDADAEFRRKETIRFRKEQLEREAQIAKERAEANNDPPAF